MRAVERFAGARRAELRLTAVLLEVLFGVVFPVLRDRVLEPLRPELLDPVEDVLLLRDPGGEDVRVAMVINVIQSHTSHRDHSERVGHRVETAADDQKSSGETDPLRDLPARAMALPRRRT